MSQGRARMSDSQRRAWLRIGAVVVVTVVVVYATRLAGQVLDARRALQAEAALATEVARLEAQVTALETAAADARSDEAVERWAREERQWGLEGDHVVAPVPQPSATADGSAPPAPETSESIWHRLRRWLNRDGR